MLLNKNHFKQLRRDLCSNHVICKSVAVNQKQFATDYQITSLSTEIAFEILNKPKASNQKIITAFGEIGTDCGARKSRRDLLCANLGMLLNKNQFTN